MNIVITGASSGIGYELVRHLAMKETNQVFVISRNERKLLELEAEVNKMDAGGKIVLLAGDLTKPSDQQKWQEVLATHCRHVDILINNAGLLINKLFDQLSDKDWQEVYATNVIGVASLIRNVLPYLKNGQLNTVNVNAQARAHIVNISSIGGMQGSAKFKGLSAYSSSKAALIVMTECLAEEFKDFRIAVNCLALGSVQTEMFNQAFPGLIAACSPAQMAAYMAEFAQIGQLYYNGKTLPVSSTTP